MINAINASHQSVKPCHQASCQSRPKLLSICYSPGEGSENLCKKQMFPEVRHIASAKMNKGYLPVMICEAPGFLAESACWASSISSCSSISPQSQGLSWTQRFLFDGNLFQNTSSACPIQKRNTHTCLAATPSRTWQTPWCTLAFVFMSQKNVSGIPAATSSCGCQTTFSSRWQVSICKSYGSLSRNDSNRKIAPISGKGLNFEGRMCLTLDSTRTASISHTSHFPPPALQHEQMCPRILQLYPWYPWSSLTSHCHSCDSMKCWRDFSTTCIKSAFVTSSPPCSWPYGESI